MNPLQGKSGTHSRWLRGRWAEVRIHATLVVLVAISLFLAEPRTTLIVGGSLCFSAYAYFGFREARKAALWLSPLSFYFFWYCIGMGLSPLYLGLTTLPGDSIRFATDSTMVTVDDLAKGYVLFLVGSFTMHLGMQIFRPIAQSGERSEFRRNLLRWLALIWLVGFLFQLRPSAFGFLGGPSKILAVALVGSICSFAVTRRRNLGLSSIAYAVVLVVGTGGLFFGNLASGSKAFIMFSFLPVFWFFITRPRLRLWIPALALVLGFFYFALVSPVVHTSRLSPLEEGKNPREQLLETFETWSRERPQQLDQDFFANQLDEFLNRQFDAVPVGFLVGEVEQSGLLFGETMKYATYAFVPRIIWPDKPTVTRGAWFSTRLGLSDTEGDATTSLGMSAVGELYWNFGTFGVLLGMFAIGCGIGMLWRMAGADPRGKPIHMLLYVSLMLAMPDMPEAVTVFVSLTLSFVTFKAAIVAFDLASRHAVKRTTVLKTEFSPR